MGSHGGDSWINGIPSDGPKLPGGGVSLFQCCVIHHSVMNESINSAAVLEEGCAKHLLGQWVTEEEKVLLVRAKNTAVTLDMHLQNSTEMEKSCCETTGVSSLRELQNHNMMLCNFETGGKHLKTLHHGRRDTLKIGGLGKNQWWDIGTTKFSHASSTSCVAMCKQTHTELSKQSAPQTHNCCCQKCP